MKVLESSANHGRDHLQPQRLWVLTCAFLTLSGWILSLAGLLDTRGYILVGVVGFALAVIYLRRSHQRSAGFSLKRAAWRLRHSLPLIYLLTVCMVFLGGILHPPNNYDALTYRTPRVLHWLAEHRWHWISTEEVRLNISGTGIEWLSAPVLALLGTDRPLFLLNALPYLFMPGLSFSILWRLGVRKRLAWHWMWLLPLGYCYALQAGSAGNDLLSTLYFLAALHWFLKGAQNSSLESVLMGGLAASLMTGVKASNLPLLLPLLLAVIPGWRLLLRGWKLVAFSAPVWLVISFLPTAVANFHYSGSWEGDPHNTELMKLQSPAIGLVGNSLQIVASNLTPPILPGASKLNEAYRRSTRKFPIKDILVYFPRFRLTSSELAQEEGASLGMGLSAVLLCSLVRSCRCTAPLAENRSPSASLSGVVVIGGGWISFFAFMSVLGSESTPRIAAPYYPLLIASVLLLVPSQMVQERWWKLLTLLAAVSTIPAVILTPSRPLWPALTVLRMVQDKVPDFQMGTRAYTVYAVYRARPEALNPVLEALPAECGNIGLISGDVPETSLWRPFGTRRVWHLTPENVKRTLSKLDAVVGEEGQIARKFGVPLEELVSTNGLRVIATRELILKTARGPEQWLIATRARPAH